MPCTAGSQDTLRKRYAYEHDCNSFDDIQARNDLEISELLPTKCHAYDKQNHQAAHHNLTVLPIYRRRTTAQAYFASSLQSWAKYASGSRPAGITIRAQIVRTA